MLYYTKDKLIYYVTEPCYNENSQLMSKLIFYQILRRRKIMLVFTYHKVSINTLAPASRNCGAAIAGTTRSSPNSILSLPQSSSAAFTILSDRSDT
jgi:hypothetical protein